MSFTNTDHTTALCAIPTFSPALAAFVDEFRREHDKAYKRWPPHINLMYPFVTRSSITQAAATLAPALKQPPFALRFLRCGFFEHSKKSMTLYLEPVDCTDLEVLHAAAMACFPDLPPPARAFVPHLTLGQFRSLEAVLQAKRQFERQMAVCECELRELMIIARDGNEPFTPRFSVDFTNSSFVSTDATLWDGTLVQPGGIQNPFGFTGAVEQGDIHHPRGSLTLGPDLTATEGHLSIQLPEMALGAPAGEPLTVVLCLDRSGSMAGTPWRQVQEVVPRLGEIANESEHVSLHILLYNDSVSMVSLGQVAGSKAGGRTNFAAAFQAIEELVTPGAVAVLFMSDGCDTSDEDYWHQLEVLEAALQADGMSLPDPDNAPLLAADSELH